MMVCPVEVDIDPLSEPFEPASPEEALSLMYKEAYRRAKKRRTDYIV